MDRFGFGCDPLRAYEKLMELLVTHGVCDVTLPRLRPTGRKALRASDRRPQKSLGQQLSRVGNGEWIL
eukprot:s4102_g6.t1